MILIGFSIEKVLLGVLFVSLALLVLIIAYRKLLAYLGKGSPAPKDYCVLYSIEQDPVVGEVEIYFTTTFEIRFLIFSNIELAAELLDLFSTMKRI